METSWVVITTLLTALLVAVLLGSVITLVQYAGMRLAMVLHIKNCEDCKGRGRCSEFKKIVWKGY